MKKTKKKIKTTFNKKEKSKKQRCNYKVKSTTKKKIRITIDHEKDIRITVKEGISKI